MQALLLGIATDILKDNIHCISNGTNKQEKVFFSTIANNLYPYN